MVELARRPCGGIVRILRRLSSHREAVPPTVPSPCVARPLWNWQRLYSVGPPRRPWPPERPGHPPEATGGVHDGIGALPNGIGLCPLATVPARAGNGGTGSPPLRGYRQNFTKALRAAGRPPEGGSASLEAMGGGVHDGKGAFHDGIGTLPARDRARKGWARSNWLAARAGASSEFYEGSPSRREASGGWLGLCGGQGGGVHDGIGVLPDRIGLCPLATVPPPCPALAGTIASGQSPIPSGNAPIPSCTPAARRAFVKF